MNKDKSIKDLKQYNDKIKNQLEYSKIRVWNLERENERLKEENKDNEQLIETQLRGLEKQKQIIDKAINKVQYIIDIGFDYDGYNDVDNLKILVDELVDLARQTKNILNGKE